MAEPLEIPITQDQAFLQVFIILVTLAGNNYYLKFNWNEQSLSYYVSIYDSNNLPLLVGIPMVIDYDLTSRFQIPGLFPGILWFFDSSREGMEAAFGDLGQRCKVLYQETFE